jgi:hypothetical protein
MAYRQVPDFDWPTDKIISEVQRQSYRSPVQAVLATSDFALVNIVTMS